MPCIAGYHLLPTCAKISTHRITDGIVSVLTCRIMHFDKASVFECELHVYAMQDTPHGILP